MKVPSVWSSVEADCWSRDFNYEDYLKYHKQSGCISSPLTVQGYLALCAALDADFDSKMRYEE